MVHATLRDTEMNPYKDIVLQVSDDKQVKPIQCQLGHFVQDAASI